ncbi:MAG: sel1 repeat family protein [Pseudomonadota bacterium]
MRISSRSATFALLLALALPAAAAAADFKSPGEALKQGESAYRGGFYELAIPALEHAAAANMFMAQYLLARIYANNRISYTDHAKAYVLYQKLANDHADVDPEDDARAPFVATALIELAGYLRRGLPEFGIRRDASRAAEYIRHAATFLDDERAQFELAKMTLEGDGVMQSVQTGLHLLSRLSQDGHAPAQAFLADLYWRGQYVEKDAIKAYALITVAVRNAPADERVWIEDIYQTIYCGSAEGVRAQATGTVAEWSRRYGRAPQVAADPDPGDQGLDYVRVCANGEPVPLQRRGEVAGDEGLVGDLVPHGAPGQPIERQRYMLGGAAGSVRAVGATQPAPAAR